MFIVQACFQSQETKKQVRKHKIHTENTTNNSNITVKIIIRLKSGINFLQLILMSDFQDFQELSMTGFVFKYLQAGTTTAKKLEGKHMMWMPIHFPFILPPFSLVIMFPQCCLPTHFMHPLLLKCRRLPSLPGWSPTPNEKLECL